MGGEGLFGRFEELRRSEPEAAAVLDVADGRSLSRDELVRLADRLAPSLRTLGSRVVALQAPNGPELIAAVFAAWREGLVPLPIDRERSPEDVDAVARALGIGAVLCGPALESREVADVGAVPELPAGTAVLKLTSGSMGDPTAVAVGGEALAAGFSQICSTMRIGPEDRNLVTLPLAHSYAFDNVLGSLVMQGTPAVLLSDLVPRRLVSVLRDTHVTVWPAVPLLLDVLARSPVTGASALGSLRLVISAGSPLPRATRENFAERFGIRPRSFYGATECGGIAFDHDATPDVPDGCVGRPLDGVSVELVDVEDGVGRIRVHSASVASAKLPEGDAEIGDGSLLASDLGRLDEKGRLHLIGRVGEFVKIHGHKVYPVEVERVIRATDGVRDAAVVPYLRSRVSEGLRAVVVVDDGIDRDAIVRACEHVLPSYKVPRSIEIRDELPRNERGKLDRRRL